MKNRKFKPKPILGIETDEETLFEAYREKRPADKEELGLPHITEGTMSRFVHEKSKIIYIFPELYNLKDGEYIKVAKKTVGMIEEIFYREYSVILILCDTLMQNTICEMLQVFLSVNDIELRKSSEESVESITKQIFPKKTIEYSLDTFEKLKEGFGLNPN